MVRAAVGSPPIAQTSLSALSADRRPTKYGSSSGAAKKSVVTTSGLPAANLENRRIVGIVQANFDFFSFRKSSFASARRNTPPPTLPPQPRQRIASSASASDDPLELAIILGGS